MTEAFKMPWLCDMHRHCRTGKMAAMVTPIAAKTHQLIVAMPNLGTDRIRTPDQAVAYRDHLIGLGRPHNPLFNVTVPLYLEPDTDTDIVATGWQMGAWDCAKIYPKNGTTNADFGIDLNRLEELSEVFDVMDRLGMPVLFHAEVQHDLSGNEIDPFDKEQRTIEILDRFFERHPRIKTVIEHVTTAQMVHAIERWQREGRKIGATVAPQYLVWNRGQLFRGGLNPVWYSIPPLKTEDDRAALVRFVTESTIPWLGTDDAPHPIEAKSRPCGCPGGVFNGPVSPFIYYEVFKLSGKPDWGKRFIEFACLRGPAFYGIEINVAEQVMIAEKPWVVPNRYEQNGVSVLPMFAGEMMPYDLVPCTNE